jgi:hypothetical protein
VLILVSGSTRVVRQLAPLGGLGILLTPGNWNTVASVVETGLPWAIDNGAFSGFDPVAFRELVGRAAGQPRLLWVVCPDVVGDARGTLALWGVWEGVLRAAGVPVAFVLQDGQERYELPDAACYFIGGSTGWKLSETAADLAAEGKRRGAWVHMGRVNSLRRLSIAHDMGCDSVDGSGYSRFAAVARSKGRRDMMLERHLKYVSDLRRTPLLY